jgi:hypothetical protein
MMLILYNIFYIFRVNLGQRKNTRNDDALFLEMEVVWLYINKNHVLRSYLQLLMK